MARQVKKAVPTRKIELMPHQEAGLKEADGRNDVAFFWDPGLGKTFVGAEQAWRYGTAIITICQKSKVRDWIRHWRTYYPAYVYDLSKAAEMDQFLANEDPDKVGVINYELFWRREKLLKMRGVTLVCDESSLISNEKSKRSKAVTRMHTQGRLEHVILLSGTPTTNGKYERLWVSALLLGWYVKKRRFWDEFVRTSEIHVPTTPYPVQKVVGYKNTERLKKRLREHGAQFLKSDFLGLPEQIDIPVSVPVCSAYKRFLKNRVVAVDGTELVGDTALTMRLRLWQLCGAYNSDKIQALKDIVESNGESLIVFYKFTEDARQIREALSAADGDLHIYEESGAVKESEEFVNDPDRAVILIQYAAGAMGLNLQGKSRIVVYFSPVDMSDLYDQSRARTHRIGQTRPCLYYHLVCEGSIEEKIEEAVKRGSDYTLELFRQDFRLADEPTEGDGAE